MFKGELDGLNAIRSSDTLFAPRPITTGTTDDNRHFLVMDYLNITRLDKNASKILGSKLADMHMCNWVNKCGLYTYRYIPTREFSKCLCSNRMIFVCPKYDDKNQMLVFYYLPSFSGGYGLTAGFHRRTRHAVVTSATSVSLKLLVIDNL